MADEPEVIKQQMEETRTSISDKLEKLEQHVASAVEQTTGAVTETVETVKDAVQGTVQAVKGTVQDTVETVKETVQDTVDTVKETFDLRRQMEAHPWAMFGGSVAVGFLLGQLLPAPAAAPGRRHRTFAHGNGKRSQAARTAFTQSAAPMAAGAPGAAPSGPPPASATSDLLSTIGEALGPALDTLKGLAIGTTTGLLGEMVLNAVPESFKDQVRQAIDEVTVKLGGRQVWKPGESGLFASRAHEPAGAVGGDHGRRFS